MYTFEAERQVFADVVHITKVGHQWRYFSVMFDVSRILALHENIGNEKYKVKYNHILQLRLFCLGAVCIGIDAPNLTVQ